MIHSVAQIISFVSQSLTLFPGDVILTGTPAGVGPIQAGDELEAEIDDWPRLRNTVAIAQDSPTGNAERSLGNTISNTCLRPSSIDISK